MLINSLYSERSTPAIMLGPWAEKSTYDAFDSLIWVERYRDPGEFVMQTKDVATCLQLFPKGKLVGVTGRKEVAIVESHEIVLEKGKQPTLKVSGRSIDAVLDHKICIPGSYPIMDPSAPGYEYLWNLGSSTAEQCVWSILRMLYDESEPIYFSNLDKMKSIVISMASRNPGPSVNRWLRPGYAGPMIREILAEQDLGLRNKNVALSNGSHQMDMLIHDGQDLSSQIIFSEVAGHFISSRSYSSISEYKNNCFLRTNNKALKINVPSRPASSGLNARWILENKDSGIPTPAGADNTPLLQEYGRGVILKTPSTNLFDGELSSEVPFKCGVDYDIGDIVQFQGIYDFSSTMRVTEVTLTQNAEGERIYPGFSPVGV